MFAGGAAGSAVAAASFSTVGWAGVVVAGPGFLLVAAVALTWQAARSVQGPAGRPAADVSGREDAPGLGAARARVR